MKLEELYLEYENRVTQVLLNMIITRFRETGRAPYFDELGNPKKDEFLELKNISSGTETIYFKRKNKNPVKWEVSFSKLKNAIKVTVRLGRILRPTDYLTMDGKSNHIGTPLHLLISLLSNEEYQNCSLANQYLSHQIFGKVKILGIDYPENNIMIEFSPENKLIKMDFWEIDEKVFKGFLMKLELKQKIVSCRLCDPLGISYHNEREENLDFAYSYLPNEVKILWIVESPPHSDPPRYFYRPELTRFDSLFRETMKALNIQVSNPKNNSLNEFKNLGHFLIDSMKCPADKNNANLKPQMRTNCSNILKEEIISLNPENIFIIKADVYDPVANLIKEIDFEFPELQMSSRILNKSTIPFPGSRQQVRFREAINRNINNI